MALLATSGCRWVAEYSDVPSSFDGGLDGEGPVVDGASPTDANVSPVDGGQKLAVVGSPTALGEGHSPVVTAHGDGYGVACIAPGVVRVVEWFPETDAIGLDETFVSQARTPAIASTGSELFVAWAEEDDSGVPTGIQVSRDFAAPVPVCNEPGAFHESPRFFFADDTLQILASYPLYATTPCTTHTKMARTIYDGADWGACGVVYPPLVAPALNGWSAYLPRVIECAGTCGAESHGLLWLHSLDSDPADGNGGASVLTSASKVLLRFTPVLPSAIAAATTHVDIGLHPYNCQTPHLPRRRPAALHAESKVFVAWSGSLVDGSQPGLYLSTLTPGVEWSKTDELVAVDGVFPQLLTLGGPDAGQRQRIVIYVRQDPAGHEIAARFFDAEGMLIGDEITLLTRSAGYDVQSLDVAARGNDRIGIVFSEENMMSGAPMPVRHVHLVEAHFDATLN